MIKRILFPAVVLLMFSCQNEDRNDKFESVQIHSDIKKMNIISEDGGQFVVSINLKTNKTIETEGSRKFEKFINENANYVMCYESDNYIKVFKNENSLKQYLNSQAENNINQNQNISPINTICSGYVNLYDDLAMSNMIATYTSKQAGVYLLNNLGTSMIKFNNSSFMLYGPKYCYLYNYSSPVLSSYRNYIYFNGYEKSGLISSFLVYDSEKKIWIDYNNKIFRIDVMGEHCYVQA